MTSTSGHSKVTECICSSGDPANDKEQETSRVTVVLPQSGACIVESDGRSYYADPVTALVFPIGARYRSTHVTPDENPRFDDPFPATLTFQSSEIEATRNSVGTAPRTPRFNMMILQLFHGSPERHRNPHAAPDLVRNLMLELDAATVGVPTPPAEHLFLVERVVRLLVSRLFDPPSLDEVAETAGSSKYHLCRVFKDVTNQTIKAYEHHLRLHEALRQVLAGDVDLATIAFDLGYSSHSHFTEMFRREFGFPPSRLRQRLRSSAPGTLGRAV